MKTDGHSFCKLKIIYSRKPDFLKLAYAQDIFIHGYTSTTQILGLDEYACTQSILLPLASLLGKGRSIHQGPTLPRDGTLQGTGNRTMKVA
jgi:hypothetical protein